MYWEKWGNRDYCKINVSIVPMENYIVFHGYYGDIFLAVNMISPIFPTFPSTLVPFLRGQNHIYPAHLQSIRITTFLIT